MAPTSITKIDIPDLIFSSLELDSRSSKPSELLDSPMVKRSASDFGLDNPLLPRNDDASPILSPMDTFRVLTARDTQPTKETNPGAGSVDPNDINMKGIQAVFALIGVAFVVGIIWFFFWAKNGGFKFQKGDWDEYKSTVLRRKGPNGTTLSNATKSTALGGGSVVGDGYSDKDDLATVDGTVIDGMTETMTDLSSEAPIIQEKRSRKLKKETAKERKVREANEATWEGGHDDDVRAYRHERPARVGGLNKDSDGQYYGTDYTESDRTGSETNSNSYAPPPPRHSSPEKRQNRRDFSFGEETFGVRSPPTAAAAETTTSARPPRYHSPNKNTSPQRPIRTVPGAFNEPLDFDVQSQNTKSYHHPLPGLSGQNKNGGGYRRDRRDSLDD